MAVMKRHQFEKVIKNILDKFCDKKIADIKENIDPEGFNKLRTVIWYFKPYTFTAKYLFAGTDEAPNFAPLGITARLDGSTEDEILKTDEALADKIQKARLMQEAGIV